MTTSSAVCTGCSVTPRTSTRNSKSSFVGADPATGGTSPRGGRRSGSQRLSGLGGCDRGGRVGDCGASVDVASPPARVSICWSLGGVLLCVVVGCRGLKGLLGICEKGWLWVGLLV